MNKEEAIKLFEGFCQDPVTEKSRQDSIHHQFDKSTWCALVNRLDIRIYNDPYIIVVYSFENKESSQYDIDEATYTRLKDLYFLNLDPTDKSVTAIENYLKKQ